MKKGLYISGAIGLGALLGAGCGGVRVDPVEDWDEPAAVQRYSNFGDVVDVSAPGLGIAEVAGYIGWLLSDNPDLIGQRDKMRELVIAEFGTDPVRPLTTPEVTGSLGLFLLEHEELLGERLIVKNIAEAAMGLYSFNHNDRAGNLTFTDALEVSYEEQTGRGHDDQGYGPDLDGGRD